MENRRSNPRFKLHQMIEIAAFRETYLNGSSVDISIDGIQCIVRKSMDIGASVFLMFEIPRAEGAYVIKCNGLITWSNQDGEDLRIGISFGDISDGDRTLLKDYIESLE